MGPRGTWGFVLDGEEKLTYNHYDSYLDGLGESLLTAWRAYSESKSLDEVKEKVRKLRLVDPNSRPDDIDESEFQDLKDDAVSSGEDYYALLRKIQGDLAATLDAGIMVDGNDFAFDSLFCEYGYVFDLDSGKFEIYKGFQDQPHERGRFAGRLHLFELPGSRS